MERTGNEQKIRIQNAVLRLWKWRETDNGHGRCRYDVWRRESRIVC